MQTAKSKITMNRWCWSQYIIQNFTTTLISRCQLCYIQGVPQYWAHFPFCHFLGFWSTYRGTSDLYSTALEICYMIGTRILKIGLEIAEIIEVKVGNPHLEVYILVFHRGRKIISMLKVATLISIISAISKSNFKILVPIM